MGVTRLEIDLKALRHNYDYLKSKLKTEVGMMAVVKAFGYGSDAAEVALYLEEVGIDYLAVAYAQEGVALRDAGVRTPILVLHPQLDNFDIILDRCLEPSIYSDRILKAFTAFAKAKKQKNYPIHIKINTGLNRLGFGENEEDLIVEQCQQTTAIKVKSIFSHLAASEDKNEETFTLDQIQRFTKAAHNIIDGLGYRPFLHQSNTSAILNYPEAQFDMVRTGIGLYGFGNSPEEDRHLKPIATLASVISQIHHIKPGESVGYNRAFQAEHYGKTATIPIGHADGISRSLGNGVGSVSIHGKSAPIIGNVCMDMIMVDITAIDCNEGDDVIIFGPQNPVSALAEKMNSISYEILTAVSQRVKRVFHR
ncbi:MAG: alanine racemase [Flavobacteriales bacterium]|jgi:alanine racemase